MLDVHGLMVRDKPASRNGVWRTYGAEDDTAPVHHLSDQEIAWNKVLGLEQPSDSQSASTETHAIPPDGYLERHATTLRGSEGAV